MIMAKKDRLNNIEDPALAFMSSTSANKAENTSGKKNPDKKAPAKESIKSPQTSVKKEANTSMPEAAPVPTLLKRPERERLTKKFMILLPESLYIKLFNASVEDDKSLNKYILDVLREHADKKGL